MNVMNGIVLCSIKREKIVYIKEVGLIHRSYRSCFIFGGV